MGVFSSFLGPLGPVVGAGLGGLAGLLGSRGQKPTKTQAMQSKLLDQLLASIRGGGPFSDLFAGDEAAFQKSYVEPAKQIFRSQIAPQILESYVSQGQQGSTGLEDSLTRAGVNLDQMLNQAMMQFQQGAQQRKMQGLSAILGAPAGPAPQISPMQSILQGVGGYLSTDQFGRDVRNTSGWLRSQPEDEPREGFWPTEDEPREGF